MLGSRGEIIPLPLSALRGSPSETYFAPGLILFCALGLGLLSAALLTWRRNPPAPMVALGVGAALLIWMAVEIAIVGYRNSPTLQPFYLFLGAVITGVGLGWGHRTPPTSDRVLSFTPPPTESPVQKIARPRFEPA